MGYLLKEALKTLCGVNQWSYAVFWKIGCQNPKLLIWEDCYYETASCSGLSGNLNPENGFRDFDASWVSAETRRLQSDVQAGDKVQLLVNKMMMDNHVNIVGEGLVGRVAFTGNHQWIMSENYYSEAHPPEVQKEVCQQFSAGMQTVAVIPVLPHGVVQFGSFLTIMENMGFVNDVTSLLLQLGYLTELPKECAPDVVNASCSFDTFNYIGNSIEPSLVDSKTSFSVAGEMQNELRLTAAAFQAPNSTVSQIGPHRHTQTAPRMKLDFSSPNHLPKAEVITNQHVSQYIPRPTPNLPSTSSSSLNRGSKISAESANQSYISMPKMPQTTNSGSIYYSDDRDAKWGANGNIISTSGELKNVIFSKMEAEDFPGFVEDDEKPKSGDDLFDVLGADFKNKLFSNCWNNRSSDESSPNVRNWDKVNLPSNKSLPSSELSGIFTSTCTDHLLEAVVSTISPSPKQSLNDDVSCGTTLTNISSSSVPNISLPYGRFGISDHVKGELFGVPTNSCSFTTGPSKEESGTYSQGSSIYGSQISSWIDKDQKGKQNNNSVSTGYSKKPDETGKMSRKRLKPGENPRPRPKDRQMIQDRFKELREIVPNGAKCSIDSLLERTIKHMLFLQSVTKHADKLKQTGDSKIISKDGGLLLKDNFDGGATWAYEVGSQSMICPIIVEDLNQPRQMLVEMLCEERGLFLEIADIIRGLGLTILKGVMETRNDKIWARFAVEANRDVTRMEIFISLLRLLEESVNSAVPQPNGIISDSTAQQFHQPAPIPIRSHSLQ